MLIIMGTSLKVHGFKKLVKEFSKSVHESAPSGLSTGSSSPKLHAGKVVFVNKTAPGSEWDGIIDYHVAGETDRWCENVMDDWRKMKPQDWEIQKTLDDDVKVVKEITNTLIAPAAKGKGTFIVP